MIRTLRLGIAMMAAATTLAITGQIRAQDSRGAALFEKKCYSCHNVGGGDKKGPDLKGVTDRRTKEWLQEFIQTPSAMNRKGDSTASGLFKKFAPEVMPDQSLAQDEMDALLALIADLTRKNETFIPAGAKLARPMQPGDAEGGRRLFSGSTALSNRGASCIACHHLNGVGVLGGGTLGPDLTVVNAKYKDPELISILQNPNFPTMNSVFATHPLTDEEIVQLFALFQEAKLANPGLQPTGLPAPAEPGFMVIGSISVVFALLIFGVLWRNRSRGVREQLVRREEQ